MPMRARGGLWGGSWDIKRLWWEWIASARCSLEDTGRRARCLGQHDTVSAARPAMQCLDRYLSQYLPTEVEDIKPDTPVFWSTFGQRRQGTVRRPMEGKNIWRLCKTYGRLIGYPMLKPHDLRHGVAMEVYEQHRDLEQVRGPLGHKRIETTQLYAQIRPAALKHAVEVYEAKALNVLSS